MKAMVYRQYGGPDVVKLEDMDRPEPATGDVLVKVEAATVTTADWRLRAAAFPSFTWLPGRLMFGLFRPRKKVLGGEFAGVVEAVGSGVTDFAVGDPVFGFSVLGSHAEYVTVKASGAILRRPDGLGPQDAAALPFGGLAALAFLRDFAEVKPADRVLVVGASGGVGAYAVQIARALGAEVDGVCGASNASLVASLGAGRVFDYRTEDFTASSREWDVILDCVGVTSLRQVRHVLAPGGRFVPLNIGWAELWQALTNRFRPGPRVVIGVNEDTKEDLQTLLGMLEAGTLRPVVDRIYPFGRISDAYAHVESRHRSGAVVLALA